MELLFQSEKDVFYFSQSLKVNILPDLTSNRTNMKSDIQPGFVSWSSRWLTYKLRFIRSAGKCNISLQLAVKIKLKSSVPKFYKSGHNKKSSDPDQVLNKFIKSLNKFTKSLNEFTKSLNKFTKSSNKFTKSLDEHLKNSAFPRCHRSQCESLLSSESDPWSLKRIDPPLPPGFVFQVINVSLNIKIL